jgi:hypothetical protein
MDASEIYAVTQAEIHGLMKSYAHDAEVAKKHLMESSDFYIMREYARDFLYATAGYDALKNALAIIGGMNVLLDDKTNEGVPR